MNCITKEDILEVLKRHSMDMSQIQEPNDGIPECFFDTVVDDLYDLIS